MEIKLTVNDEERRIEAEPGMPLLWVLRDLLGLRGTKYSCGIAQCGACTVHVNGAAVRSCIVPVSTAVEAQIRTIEGLGGDHPVQRAWLEEQVPQCGFCQSGQIMQAVALLEQNPRPSRAEIREAMNGNLCRCGTYLRIERAIERAAGLSRAAEDRS